MCRARGGRGYVRHGRSVVTAECVRYTACKVRGASGVCDLRGVCVVCRMRCGVIGSVLCTATESNRKQKQPEAND